MLELTGRGERIRTSDLTIPNDRRGKNVSICLFESCSHQRISSVLHPFPFLTSRYRLCAENSVHKLATNHQRRTLSRFSSLFSSGRMLCLMLSRSVFGSTCWCVLKLACANCPRFCASWLHAETS